MSTADLISAAKAGMPPIWRAEAISTRVPMGDFATAASALDKCAEARGLIIGEVAVVTKSGMDVVYARANGEPQ